MKLVFDLKDESWTWSDLAKALEKRASLSDISDLILVLLLGQPKLLKEVIGWPLITNAIEKGKAKIKS